MYTVYEAFKFVNFLSILLRFTEIFSVKTMFKKRGQMNGGKGVLETRTR
jgi:hypothetical protein